MKKVLTAGLALALALSLAGCGRWGIFSNEVDRWIADAGTTTPAPGDDYGSSQGDSGDDYGYYEGGLGDTMSNVFFDYTVLSAQLVDSYEGYTPAAEMTLLDTVIEVENTFGSELPMSIYDFQVQWGSGDEDFGYQVESLGEGSATCMPTYYDLEAGESATYHVVYEVPAGLTEFSISYLERYEDESTGDVFFVYFTVADGTAAASGVSA